MPGAEEIPQNFTSAQNVTISQHTSYEQTMMPTDFQDDRLETHFATVSILDDFLFSYQHSSSEDSNNSNEVQPSSGFLSFDFQQPLENDNMELGQVYEEIGRAVPEPSPLLSENNMGYYNNYYTRSPKKRKITHQDTSDELNSNAMALPPSVLPPFYAIFESSTASDLSNSNVLPPFYATFMSLRANAGILTWDGLNNASQRTPDPIIRYCKYVAYVEKQKTTFKIRLSRNLNNLLDMVEVVWLDLRCEGYTNAKNTKKLLQCVNEEINKRKGRGDFLLYRRNRKPMKYFVPRPKFHSIPTDNKSKGENDEEVENKILDLANDIPNAKIGKAGEKIACPRRRIRESFYHFFLRNKMEKKMLQSPNEVDRILRAKNSYPDYRIVTSEVEAIYVRFKLGRIFENGRPVPVPTSKPQKIRYTHV